MTDGPDWKDEYPDDAPESAADPRENGEPYFIDDECEECGEELVQYHELPDEDVIESDALAQPVEDEPGWHDEFVCPDCLDGVYLDHPQMECVECGEEYAIAFFDDEGRCSSCIPEDEIEPLETTSLEDIEEILDIGDGDG